MEVPEVIVILKNKLIELNGLTAEGIFRKTGNESDIVENKNLLNTFSPLITNDPHTIASLLKVLFFHNLIQYNHIYLYKSLFY